MGRLPPGPHNGTSHCPSTYLHTENNIIQNSCVRGIGPFLLASIGSAGVLLPCTLGSQDLVTSKSSSVVILSFYRKATAKLSRSSLLPHYLNVISLDRFTTASPASRLFECDILEVRSEFNRRSGYIFFLTPLIGVARLRFRGHPGRYFKLFFMECLYETTPTILFL